MPRDIGEAKQVRKDEARAKRKTLTAAEHLRAVMDTESGRAVMRGIVGMGDLMSDGYVAGGRAAQREQDRLTGRRGVAVEVLTQINAVCPASGELMLREGHEAEKREREELEAAETDSTTDQPENTDG